MKETSKHGADRLVAAADAAGLFETFLKLAAAAGLLETLEGEGPFTLFAPTDEAFAKFPAETLAKLQQKENKSLLRAVIGFHFAPGRVQTARFAGKRINAKTFEGGVLLIDGADGVRVNGALVVAPDLSASNGVIHGIDRVLWPKTAQAEQAAL